MVNITINGRQLNVEAGLTVLQAAQQAGIDIPTLCHHPAVADIGACRICLVEVAKQRVLQPACTYPVNEGMEVQTESPKAVAARKFVLELLFSERNHYCMYCQMSGDCELQALAYRYGMDHWTYDRPYEPMPVDATRRYFSLDHNRCILCRRCIRACSDVSASHTLGTRQRGSKTMISADFNVPFGESTCVSCGTCLQVCPTGALIDRHSAYRGRQAEVQHSKTVCAACPVGCGVDVVHRANHVVRIDGDWDAAPSKGLLCVSGRFEPLDEVRPRVQPMVRQNGVLKEVSWNEAVAAAARGLKGAQSAAAVATGRATNETYRALADLFKAATLWERPVPQLGGQPATLADLEAADVIVVAGADPGTTHKVVAYVIRRALDKGARLYMVGGEDTLLAAQASEIVADAGAAALLQKVAGASAPVVVYGAGLGPTAAAALKGLGGKARTLRLIEGTNAAGAAQEGVATGPLAKAGDALFVLAGDAPAVPADLPKARFLVVQSAFQSALTEKADVVLPSPAWAEREGHLTSMDGQVRDLEIILAAPEGVPTEWQALVALKEQVGGPLKA